MEEIKSMLLQEKKDLISEILKNKDQIAMEHEIGDAIDNSVDEQERKLAMLLQDREHEKLEMIEEALIRIDDDDYGICEECSEPISKKRLMVVPFAKMCINCQQEEERLRGLKIDNEDADGTLRYIED